MTLPDDLFAAGGETGRLMALRDWAATDLGPVRDWPQSLRAAVRIVLSSRYPMLLLWGPDFTQLYNDAYSALIGDKHPAALGLDVRITLAEGWDVLRPLISDAMATGVASWVPALRLLLDRAGYREEAYFSVSHAPARDDEGVTVGVLTVCSEVTDQVVGERRLRLLRDLALPGGAGTAGVQRTCDRLGEVIGEHPLDVPFAAVYLRDGGMLRRCATVGGDPAALPEEIVLDAADDDPWRLRTAAGGETAEMTDVGERLALTGGPWDDPVRAAVAQPLPSADRSQPVGVLLTGLSPSRALDETYRSFLQLLAQQAAVAIRNAQAYQEERDRGAALAELDRVKTDFFTNVSHEFRTPLTLMLGPLADALADRAEPLGEAQRTRVELAARNADRLLTLVNELLTFASIGAGGTGTAPRALDLAEFTRELAGVFRAAIERTGLRLVVDCPPLPGPVAVDPAHWERIVANLLSNALKFTFVGEIRVGLRSDATTIRLTVSDTGIGIDAAELPRLFDRFHRVRGARSRSHEGTGIGLALVRELTRLVGGDVEVASEPGNGTTFTVVLPWTAVRPAGVAALERVPDRLAGALAAATETAGWTDPRPAPAEQAEDERTPGAVSILVADDNSDMRAYLTRLLTAEGWRVRTAADGEAALQAIRRSRPQLLITDVMMPRMDGFALVRALRADEATRGLPIVMLSARAGRESGVEGLAAGADDYVVKPFSAPELIARVRGTLELANARATDTRPPAALAGTVAVMAAGRALQEAFLAATDRARALLGAAWAVAVLDGAGEGPPLVFRAPADAGDQAAGTAEAEIRDGDGTPIGSLTVGYEAGQPPASPGPMTETLALLARGSWLPEHERQLTLALQEDVLPDSLPARDGWDLHGAYRPAVAGAAGGAWYDVLDAGGGTLMVGIGDVAGHGPGAAVAAGQLRTAVRACVVAGLGPARTVTRIAGLLSTLTTPLSATLLVALVDPGSGRITWCSAGHPAPVRAPGRALTGSSGPALGVTGGVHPQNDDVLAHGDLLLLHTDGLHPGGLHTDGLDAGPDRLGQRGQQALTTLVSAVLADVAAPHDDIAVVALRRRPVAETRVATSLPQVDRTWTYPLEPGAAGTARRDLAGVLDGDDTDPDLLYDLQVAVTEAINNAIEHAQQPSRPEVRMHLRVAGGLVRVEVQDFGDWRARPAARDRGRGALLMNAYGEVRVVTTEDGTLVTIEREWAA